MAKLVTENDSLPEFLKGVGVRKVVLRSFDSIYGASFGEPGSMVICINSNKNEIDRLKTLIHELIHVIFPDWNGNSVREEEFKLMDALGIERDNIGACGLPESVSRDYSGS